MGFQPPPALPDYSKLIFKLANSGVQKWNPPIYDILFQLIQAVQQSQNVITDDRIPEAVSNINVSSSVIADVPLTGDGSSGSHLILNKDAHTMALDGSNNLQAGLIARTANFAANIPAGTTVSGVIPALSGYVAWPLFGVAEVKYTGYTTGRSISLRYNGNTTDLILFANVIGGGGVARNRWLLALPLTINFDVSVGRIDNKALDLVFSGANSAFTAGDSLIITIYYIYLLNNLP